MKKLIFFLSSIIAIISCSPSDNEELTTDKELIHESIRDKYRAPAVFFDKKANAKLSSQNSKHARKVIWTANLKFQVKSVDSATKKLQEVTAHYGGYVSNMSLSSTNYRITNTIEIRIANDQFDKLTNEFKKEAIFVDEFSIRSNDVTEEFIDLESRLKTKKEARDRYIHILKNKAGSVEDIIHTEEAIRKITEEIEAKEGRLRYLKNKVNFSTITASIYQKVDYKEEPKVYKKSYLQKLTIGLKNGWSIITTAILFFVNIWPLVIVLSLIIWKRKWLFRKVKNKR